MGFPAGTCGRPCSPIQETQETWVWFLVWEDLWSRKWQPTAVSSSGKSHGQRSPWGHKSWTQLSTHTLTGLDEVSRAGPHPPQGGTNAFKGRGKALSLCHLRTVRRQQAVWKQRREPLPELHHAGTLVSDFQAPKRWENKYLLFKLPGLWELSRSWRRYHIFSLVVILREQEFNSFPRGIWLSLDLLRKYVYRTGMPQTLSQELKTPISSS